MSSQRVLCLATFITLLQAAPLAMAQQAASAPLPEIPQLLREVQEHQKQLEKVRENYTYTSLQTTQDIDSNGQVKRPRARRARTSSSTAT